MGIAAPYGGTPGYPPGGAIPGGVYLALDALLLLDILLTFKTPVYHNGEVSHDHRVVARAYLRSNKLLLDVLGISQEHKTP